MVNLNTSRYFYLRVEGLIKHFGSNQYRKCSPEGALVLHIYVLLVSHMRLRIL